MSVLLVLIITMPYFYVSLCFYSVAIDDDDDDDDDDDAFSLCFSL